MTHIPPAATKPTSVRRPTRHRSPFEIIRDAFLNFLKTQKGKSYILLIILILSLLVYFRDQAFVALASIAITLLSTFVYLQDSRVVRQIEKHISDLKLILGATGEFENIGDFSARLESMRDLCLRHKTPTLVTLNSGIIAIINDINPRSFKSFDYRSIYAQSYFRHMSIFHSSLTRWADQIVRIALLLTFGGIAFALIVTTAGLSQLQSTTPQFGSDQSEPIKALVGGLIAAASFKFIISAVGLACALTLRSLATRSETRLNAQLQDFLFLLNIAVDEFLRNRLTGKLSRTSGVPDLSQIMTKLTSLLEHNEHTRKAVAEELLRGFHSVVASMQVKADISPHVISHINAMQSDNLRKLNESYSKTLRQLNSIIHKLDRMSRKDQKST